MSLQVTRTGGDFQKVVFDNVEETIVGGIALDLTGYTAAVNGVIPAGTLVGINKTTGIGKIVADPAVPGTGITLLGLTYANIPAEDNCLTGVVISGTVRLKAMPTNEQTKAAGIATALPKLTIY